MPVGNMWNNGRIHDEGGRMLTARESRILLHASGTGVVGRVAPTTPPVVRPSSTPWIVLQEREPPETPFFSSTVWHGP